MKAIDFPGYGDRQSPSFIECNWKVLRSTNWNMPTGFISDKTRAGTRKVRAANTAEPNSFSVTLRFKTLDDYTAFDTWYNTTDRKGLIAFNFRNIKNKASASQTAVYRFTQDGTPQVTNTAGEIVDVSMGWEEA